MSDSLMGMNLGEYVIGEQIDEGGMGSIYRAFKPNSREGFVVKILLPEYSSDPYFRKRFEREVMLLQALQHPHIIPIFDFGEVNDLLYFVMPFIKGMSLGNMLQKHRFSPASTWMIVEPVAQALHYAHENRVIHRDLKPANILMGFKGPSQDFATYPYLADFGLSKPVDKSTMTQNGMAIGTPHYMSPEQVRAFPVTPQTDVYALGIVVYEMLLGRVPFWKGTPDAIAFQQVRDQPPRPRMLHADFPKPIEAVILRALAKDPAERFESAEEFGGAYWEALQSLTPEARRHEYWIE